ncbi:hypothetical protein NQ318_004955 [Aromia moschata]|uniref:Cytochrome P450 n=1 Tax=Aromia moschata TaxID=1265417 RepID=A0AAV8XBT1_9CUCU|nr:hypothetical protein NQ318_004955 [Aromia moschata]
MSISTGSCWVDLIGICTALVAVAYAYFKWSFGYWKRRNVPYLEPKIPFGNLGDHFNKKMSDSECFEKMYSEAKSKGTKYCGIYIMQQPHLLILDLELSKQILAKDFIHFTDRGMYTNEKDDPLSAHLFSLGGSKWKNLRTKLTPTFTSGKMKQMFQTLVDTGVILENFFQENVSSDEAVDIKDVLGRFSTDVIGSCAFGIECNSFKEPDSSFRIYGKKVFEETALEAIKGHFCNNFGALARLLGIKMISTDVSNFFTKMVEDVVSYREKNNVIRKDFMQLLIDLKNKNNDDKSGEHLTMNELMAQSFVFFVAGFESSSTTMTFALFELATHSNIQEKVRKEIKSVLAKHDNKMTYDSLNELKYMKQVIDGERFGIMQAKVGLTSILKNFRVKVHQKTELPLKFDPKFFIPSTLGTMWLTFEKI